MKDDLSTGGGLDGSPTSKPTGTRIAYVSMTQRTPEAIANLERKIQKLPKPSKNSKSNLKSCNINSDSPSNCDRDRPSGSDDS